MLCIKTRFHDHLCASNKNLNQQKLNKSTKEITENPQSKQMNTPMCHLSPTLQVFFSFTRIFRCIYLYLEVYFDSMVLCSWLEMTSLVLHLWFYVGREERERECWGNGRDDDNSNKGKRLGIS